MSPTLAIAAETPALMAPDGLKACGWQRVSTPPATPPPPPTDIWWGGIWAWTRHCAYWTPVGAGALRAKPGQGPVLAAPAELPPRGLLGAGLIAPQPLATAALVAFAAFGRGRTKAWTNPIDQAVIKRQQARAVVFANAALVPSGWWQFDLARWWEDSALVPLITHLLWKRRGTSQIPPTESFSKCSPAAREGIRQLLLSAAEMGLSAHDLPDLFLPGKFG